MARRRILGTMNYGDLHVQVVLTRDEARTIADALDILAGIDEGEHTDYEELVRLASELNALPGVRHSPKALPHG